MLNEALPPIWPALREPACKYHSDWKLHKVKGVYCIMTDVIHVLLYTSKYQFICEMEKGGMGGVGGGVLHFSVWP